VLLEARTALASLDGTGKHLPNPELLLRPLQHREAQRSSSLEGTITPREQALFLLDPKYPESAEDPNNAFREGFNYGRALRHHFGGASRLPLSLRLIRDLHAILMEGVRGASQSPGEFRTSQNFIGRPPRSVPPPVTDLGPGLDSFEKYLHLDKRLDPLVEAFLVHYQFEALHPFSDGNGRVGRLLLAITIAEWCRLSNEWLYMSDYFERNKDSYIDLMFRVSTHGDWQSWIDFCLRGVAEQALDAQRRCDRLLELQRDFHERVGEIGGSVRLVRIVDALFESPVVTVTSAQRLLEVTYPTARADLRRLEAAGILERIEGVGQITYVCGSVLRITYED
jgi:Fic family protein